MGRDATSAKLYFPIAFSEIVAQLRAFSHVEDIKNRLLTQEHESAQTLLVFGRHFHFSQWPLGSQVRIGSLQQVEFFFQLWSAHLLQIFFQTLQPLFDLAKIADHEVEIYVLDIAKRIDRPDVRNGWIVKRPHNVRQCVYIAQVADVSAFLKRFLPDCPHVHILNGGVSEFLGIIKSGQAIKAVVRYLGHPDVSLTRIGICLVGKIRFGENSEKRCLAYLGQANDAGFHIERREIKR